MVFLSLVTEIFNVFHVQGFPFNLDSILNDFKRETVLSKNFINSTIKQNRDEVEMRLSECRYKNVILKIYLML